MNDKTAVLCSLQKMLKNLRMQV